MPLTPKRTKSLIKIAAECSYVDYKDRAYLKQPKALYRYLGNLKSMEEKLVFLQAYKDYLDAYKVAIR